MSSGRIIVLNGPSSAGKSTLGLALREQIGPRCACVAIDQFFRLLHPSQKVDFRTYLALTRAVFAAALAFHESGLDVVVDTVFERADCHEVCLQTFASLEYWLVGVHCPLRVLEQRELARGNRRVGLAREQHERVHVGCNYDLTLDTAQLSTAECVEAVLSLAARG